VDKISILKKFSFSKDNRVINQRVKKEVDMGRRFKGVTAGVAALILLAGSLGAAEATSRIQNLAALQYSGGEGLSVAFLWVSTNDRNLDATLIVPHLDAALHPIATYAFSGQVVFKFAAKGKGVQAAGEQIHAVVTDLDPSNGTTPPEDAIATCSPAGTRYFVCRQ
jgi:hypothetical protein